MKMQNLDGSKKNMSAVSRRLYCSLILTILAGCEPTTRTVERTTDENELAKIACTAGDWRVHVAAINKLTDQTLLGKIALEEESFYAAKRLTNQMLLAKIAIESKNRSSNSSDLVFDLLTDPLALATIAIESKNRVHRLSAYRKLDSSGALAKLSMTQTNPCARLCAILYNACREIPQDHRSRVSEALLEIVGPIGRDPLVCAELGNIDNLAITWGRTSKTYAQFINNYGGVVGETEINGEVVTAAVHLSKVLEGFSWCWATDLPSSVSVGRAGVPVWRSAEFSSRVWQQDICASLSKPMLIRLATESAFPALRSAAVNKITDQALVAKIAMEDEDESVRRTAIEKLYDQPLLARIAEDKAGIIRRAASENGHSYFDREEYKVADIRSTAVKKLTDQSLLEKIAMGSCFASEDRMVATEKVLSQTVLAKIAMEDKDVVVRQAAVHNKNLTDQVLLAKFAAEDKEQFVRIAAVEKLSDQALLAKIAVEDKDGVVRQAAASHLKYLQKSW